MQRVKFIFNTQFAETTNLIVRVIDFEIRDNLWFPVKASNIMIVLNCVKKARNKAKTKHPLFTNNTTNILLNTSQVITTSRNVNYFKGKPHLSLGLRAIPY